MILGDNLVAGGVGANSVSDFVSLSALSAFLSLTSDAVAGYGADGHIIVANEHMAEYTGLAARQLIGVDVRSLLMLPSGEFAAEGSWPFTLDGTETLLHCRRPSEGSYVPIVARAVMLGDKGSFVLVCRLAKEKDNVLRASSHAPSSSSKKDPIHPPNDTETLMSTSEAIQEALAGPTISQEELWQFLGSTTEKGLAQTLFAPVVDELRSAVGADVAAIYLKDLGAFHLKALSGELIDRYMPPFIDNVDIDTIEATPRQMLGIIVPEPKLAGAGKTGLVTVGNAFGEQTAEYVASEVPPLASHYVLPLRFGDDAIAMVVVGWQESHELDESEQRVLSLLSQHLGAEVMNGLGTLRTRAADQVEQIMRRIRRSLEEAPDLDAFDYEEVFLSIARAVRGSYLPLVLDEAAHTTRLVSSDGSSKVIALDLDKIMAHQPLGDVRVESCRTSPELYRWFCAQGMEPKGVIADVRELGKKRRTFMIRRNWDAGPLESYDVTFLRRCLQDLCEVDKRRRSYIQADYISQSLQRGMGNNLQDVAGITAKGIYNSATASASVGGDFYDLIDLPGNRACIVLGDVAGKGVQAASVSSALRTAIAAYAWEGLPPAHTVRLLNDFFMSFSSLETFASLFLGIADLKAHRLTYCSAGHPPALYIHRDAQTIEFLSEQSGVVGAFREMEFREATIPIEQGDSLLLYSDGVTEARSPSGEFFGEDGLRETLFDLAGTPSEALPKAILERLYAFTHNNLNDDCALLVVRFDDFCDVSQKNDSRAKTR